MNKRISRIFLQLWYAHAVMENLLPAKRAFEETMAVQENEGEQLAAGLVANTKQPLLKELPVGVELSLRLT